MRTRSKPGTVNTLCARCLRSCRQSTGTLVVDCPRFQRRPFDVREYRFNQLDLFDGADG